MLRNLFFVLFLLLNLSATAQETVKVISVHDGDSYYVKPVSGAPFWIRLLFVDAPEIGGGDSYIAKTQPFAYQTLDSARLLMQGKKVTLYRAGTGQYMRTLGVLLTPNGNRLDSTLIANGWAWYYAPFGFLSLPKSHYLNNGQVLQNRAALKNKGLWGLSRPIEPSQWRKQYQD